MIQKIKDFVTANWWRTVTLLLLFAWLVQTFRKRIKSRRTYNRRRI